LPHRLPLLTLASIFMTDFDPVAIERWALGYLQRLSDAGRRGVLLGGSIARGQQWAHSDLEAGLLVEARDPSLSYFNVDSGRGVEIIQLIAPDLRQQLALVEGGDLTPVSTWPIQLYRARVISDPTGVLVRFVREFDRHLFSARVVALKLDHHVTKALQLLDRARALLATARPRAALCELRSAMNETVLGLHWSLGELPRSHNRVDSRLRDLTTRHGRAEFYALYRDVFELETADEVIRRDWPIVKERILKIAANWRARAFFETAVDGTFSWGENGGIISVHRLFVPLIGRAEIFDSLDHPAWAAAHRSLLQFLGLATAGPQTVSQLVGRIEHALAGIKNTSSRPAP
jgi:PAS domain-containing protein